MILQGTVRGGIYPIIQQAYDEPIDGTRRCNWCGRTFAPKGKSYYCCESCRTEALKQQHRKACRNYHRKMRTA